jgi:Protein of unknown function DUF45
MHEWHKSLLHEVIPALIRKWEPKLRLKVHGYFPQRMKTKWGSCNHTARHIRLNTELVKKPRDLLEYVIVEDNQRSLRVESRPPAPGQRQRRRPAHEQKSASPVI